jgi:hypothetical protein
MRQFTDLPASHYKKYLNLQRKFKELLSAEITFCIFKHHWLILLNNSELAGSTKDGKFIDQLSKYFPLKVSDACDCFIPT